MRFVQACVKGHLSDIDWYGFVRRDYTAEQTGVPCDEFNCLLTRSASNAYFSQRMGVISIPDAGEALREAVDRVWEDNLQYCEDLRDVAKERRRAKIKAALEGLSDEAILTEVRRRLSGTVPVEKGIKQAEIETLLGQQEGAGEGRPEGDFYARGHPLGTLPAAAAGKIDRLVLVHRLREVVAQIGFTRFEATFPDIDGELDLDIELARWPGTRRGCPPTRPASLPASHRHSAAPARQVPVSPRSSSTRSRARGPLREACMSKARLPTL